MIYRLPPDLQADLDRFREETERFKAGKISAEEYRAFRVPQGIYEQRLAGAFMLRLRLPAGAILPEQMKALSRVARKYGSGRLHLTTRQDIQVHDVPLDNIHRALVELYEAGLTTKGGGGNTVRNITACADSGVCPKESFDVSPYAVALTEFLLSDPISFQLPRKFKIAFSGCAEDCAGATVNDLGFIAKEGVDNPGFSVYAGGGMGSDSRVAQLLEEFVPAGDIHLVAEAVKRVFDKHGNRKNKHQARLRFLIKEKGFERFKELYQSELSRLRDQALSKPGIRALCARTMPRQVTKTPPGDGFDLWLASNVLPQKQDCHFMVHIPLFLGEISPDTLGNLAEIAELHGERMVRTTQSQNIVIRWIREDELPGLHRKLSAVGLAMTPPPILREAIACTGAATCRLGVCLSQGLARAVRDELENAGLELEDAVNLRLHINGCTNSCGRHPIASIGLIGTARRVGEQPVPHYVVQLGGRVGEGRTRLAEGNIVLPARNVPTFLVEFLRVFRQSSQYPDFDAFLENSGRAEAERIAGRYKRVPSFDEDSGFYYDWGAEELFSMGDRGTGECSAGRFDLIEIDLAKASECLREGRLLEATEKAARALLVTRGEDTRNSADALQLFERHFIDAGLINDSFREVIGGARRSILARDTPVSFEVDPACILAFITAVENVYTRMDRSLRLS